MEFDLSILRQLQQENEYGEERISAHRRDMNRLIDFIYNLPEQAEHREAYANYRKLKLEVVEKNKVFYIFEDGRYTVRTFPKEFRNDSFGLCQGNILKFKGRYCSVVFDIKGDVMGFLGWDKFSDVKYLDSKNYGYLAKQTTFLGEDLLPRAYKQGYFIIVEGSVCKMYLEGFGFNVGASLGSNVSDYVIRKMKRFGKNAIFIPDNDEAGDKYASRIRYCLPEARIFQSTVAKDIDDTRLKMGNDDIVTELKNIITKRLYRPKILKEVTRV